MVQFLSAIMLGASGVILSWATPLLWPKAPFWLIVSLFIFGCLLLVIGAAVGIRKAMRQRRALTESIGDIKVTMGNGNQLGNIGHKINGGR